MNVAIYMGNCENQSNTALLISNSKYNTVEDFCEGLRVDLISAISFVDGGNAPACCVDSINNQKHSNFCGKCGSNLSSAHGVNNVDVARWLEEYPDLDLECDR